MPTRRHTVVGLAGLLAGSGTVLGTGAFSQVRAHRTVNVETTGDAAAFLGLESLNATYVEEKDGEIRIDLTAGADGLPQGGRIRFDDIVQVTNQGTQTVRSIRFKFSVDGANQPDSAVEDALKIISGEAIIDATDDVNLLAKSDAGDAANNELEPGESFPFGLLVNLADGPISSIDGDPEIALTIIADTTADGEAPPGNGDIPWPNGIEYDGDVIIKGPGASSRDIEFTIENTAQEPVHVSGMIVDVTHDNPNQNPTEFESFEIDAPNEASITDTTDQGIGNLETHQSFELGPTEHVEYALYGFDGTPNLSAMELDFTAVLDDSEISLPTAEIKPN